MTVKKFRIEILLWIKYCIKIKFLDFRSYWFLLCTSFFCILSLFSIPSSSQQHKIDSLKSKLTLANNDSNYVNCLNQLCIQYKDKYEYVIADSIAEVALSEAQKLGYQNGILQSKLNLAEIQFELVNYDKSKESYIQLLYIAKKYANKYYQALIYHRLAIINIDQGNIEESLKNNLLALDLRNEIGDKKGIGYSYSNIADYYINKSDFITALNYLFKALTIFNEFGEQKYAAYTNFNIGKIYFNLRNYSETLNYYEISKNLTFAMNDFRAYATIVRSIAEVNVRIGKNEIAMKNFNEAFEVAQKINDEIATAQIFSGIGTVFQNQHKYTEAMQNFSKASVIFEKLDFKVGILVTSINVGHANIKLKNLNKAEKSLSRAKDLNKGIRFKEYDKEIYYLLFEIDSIKNNWNSAYQNYRMYTMYNDSLIRESNSKSIDSLRLNFEFTKRAIIENSNHETETALLTSKGRNEKYLLTFLFVGIIFTSGFGFILFKNKKQRELAVLSQKSAELNLKLKESNMLALRSQMNPHFIFNCVHTIDRLLKDLKINESRLFIEKFSILIRAVLENSMKNEIPLAEEMETLKHYMDLENLRFKVPFKYDFVIESGIDIETTLIPPLIMQPFIENSIKHGFREPMKSGLLKIGISNEV